MDSIQKAAKVYSRICGHGYRFSFDNGQSIVVKFLPGNFCHLAGLRKFNDLREFQVENGKPVISSVGIYKKALRGEISDHYIQTSIAYTADAKERIECLADIEQLLQTNQAIWDFDKSKLEIVTRLKSTVILFQNQGFRFYLMLGLAKNKEYYPETFFLRFDEAYFYNQKIVKVTKIEKI